jgi:dTDP-glucose pyrophosphorylase
MTRIALIPAAGRGSRMLSLTENNPKAMLPFKAKPIIGHHLDYLIQQKFDEVVIVVGYQKHKLIDYVMKFYSTDIKITFAEQTELNGLAGAVQKGIDCIESFDDESNLFIVLGDIVLVEGMNYYNVDYIGYDLVDDWSRWCMIETNEMGRISKFIDKPVKKPNTNRSVMGVYNITNIKSFKEKIDEVLSGDIKINNEYQISQALELYMKDNPILSRLVNHYYDLGDLDSLNKTRQNIARHFNNISVTKNNTIVKSSEKIEKIADEIDWYRNLDQDLKIYTPHLVGYVKELGKYELEFIHSNPLQELYMFNLPEKHEWENIFKVINRYLDKTTDVRLRDIHPIKDDNYRIIVQKTQERVAEMKKLDFTKGDYLKINNISYKNPIKHLDKILDTAFEMFCKDDSRNYFARLHGDLFFGNMLYDVNTDVLKLIDPRGKYGKFRYHGDIRYDIAKLNHSVNGYYDFIVNGLYFLEQKDNEFYYYFYESNQKMVREIFNRDVISKYNEDEIQLLTGLLFLSMIPLHSENINNQKMQFIKAVELLNKFI